MTLLLYCLGYYLMGGIVVSIGYHRFLSHRSLELVPWFEYTLVTLGLAAGTPVQWAGNHRYHHQHTDVEGDPHSPVLDGFWYAHNGWYIGSKSPWICFIYALAGPLRALYDGFHRPRSNQEHITLAKDIQENRYYAFLSKPIPYQIILSFEVFLFFGIAYVFWGGAGVVCLWFTSVFVYNFGDFVDSIAHLFGNNPYKTTHQAKNNILAGIFAAGEWHANHHTFPSSAKQGLLKGQIDSSWLCICLFARLKLAKNIHVHVPTREDIDKKIKRPPV